MCINLLYTYISLSNSYDGDNYNSKANDNKHSSKVYYMQDVDDWKPNSALMVNTLCAK